ncbi:hypothetical protein [Streptomyces sp. NPDC048411]|uniref:hypothetical protein n=1 Tax=Streptomyces sp. NPDC048411 TaxID=3157206 RepID=UPI00345727C8
MQPSARSSSRRRDAALTVRLGGRAAELVVFGEGSTCAADDLDGATQIASRMVREFGLSPALGPVGYGSGAPRYLGGESTEETLHRPYSEQTQRIVDKETARLVRQAEERAVALPHDHREALDTLAGLLTARETVDGSVVLDVLQQQQHQQQQQPDGHHVEAGKPTPSP